MDAVVEAHMKPSVTVEADMRVQTLVDEHLLRTGQCCFVVGGPCRILGLITPHEIKNLARDRWATTPLSEVMRAIGQLKTVSPDASAIEALKVMGGAVLNQLPVTTDGRFEGIGARSHIVQLLQAWAELNTPAIGNGAAVAPVRRQPTPAVG